jgi:hypothetical protein
VQTTSGSARLELCAGHSEAGRSEVGMVEPEDPVRIEPAPSAIRLRFRPAVGIASTCDAVPERQWLLRGITQWVDFDDGLQHPRICGPKGVRRLSTKRLRPATSSYANLWRHTHSFMRYSDSGLTASVKSHPDGSRVNVLCGSSLVNLNQTSFPGIAEQVIETRGACQ